MDLRNIERLLREHRCIWDPTCHEYRNRNYRERCWEEIAKSVYGDNWNSLSVANKYRKLARLKQKASKIKRKLGMEAEDSDNQNRRDEIDGIRAGPSGLQQNVNFTSRIENRNREDEAENLLLSLLPTYRLLTRDQQIDLNAKMLRSLYGQLNASTTS